MSTSGKVQRALLGVLGLLVAAIVVVLAVGHIGSGSHSSSEATAANAPFDGASMPAHLRAGNFTLTDQRGRRVTMAADRGHVVVLTFIHSLCHDSCPFMTEQIKGALNLLPGHGRGVVPIGVSVKPGQDTVRNRDRFLASHDMTGRLAFVNGPLATMRHVWHEYSISPERPGHEHDAFVLLIDKRGYERIGFAAAQLTPDGLAHDIRKLLAERA